MVFFCYHFRNLLNTCLTTVFSETCKPVYLLVGATRLELAASTTPR